MQTITNNTEAVIYGMLTENTGTHMLDSGGTDGRAWQRNALKTLEDFKNEPEAWLDASEWPEVSKSAFWHLVNNLEHDAGLTAAYHEFANDYPNESWLEINELWLDKLGIEEEGGDFYGNARWSFNSYNFDGWLVDQTIQGTTWGMANREYVILQVHGGADVRGGYTRPQVFEVVSGKDGLILDAEAACFSCSAEDCSNSLSVRSYEYELESGDGCELFTDLKEVKTCPCGGSWIN